MFYIRTGDRLQRTSTWLENLEGGIDYVRKVVCEDSLGIGAELEADMDACVDNYACEWKMAIEDPATLKRFRNFVNSDEADRNVVFVEERGQIRPATAEEQQQSAAGRGGSVTGERWHDVCALEDLVEGAGVGALVAGRQIALFQVHGRVYALDNFDPGEPRQCAVARPHRQPAGRARGRLAYLQASLRADQRALRRGSDLQRHRLSRRAWPTAACRWRCRRHSAPHRAWWSPATAWRACARSKSC